MKLWLTLVLPLLWPLAASAQEKAEIQVAKDRAETIKMRFSYAFRAYTFTLMEREMESGNDITYRFPVNIPGCDKMRDWGIVDGVLSISTTEGTLCEERVSLCDKVVSIMKVDATQCAWRQSDVDPAR